MNILNRFRLGLWGSAIVSLMGLASCNSSPQPTPSLSPSVQPSASASPSPTAPQKSQATKDLEKRLKAQVSKQSGIAVQSVECPYQLPVKPLEKFTCQAKAEGKTFAIAINASGKESELQWSTKGLLVLPKLEQTIAKGIQDQFKVKVKTACGGKVRVAKPGETFQCKIVDERGQSRAVTVRVDDEAGNVTWKL